MTVSNSSPAPRPPFRSKAAWYRNFLLFVDCVHQLGLALRSGWGWLLWPIILLGLHHYVGGKIAQLTESIPLLRLLMGD